MEAGDGPSLLNDEPVAAGGPDRFRRQPLADRLARLIEHTADGGESTVFAVVGPWGSGKTSLLNFTSGSLDPERVASVEFNPWLVSSVDGLLTDFFSTLQEAMPRQGHGKTIRDAILRYGAVAAPLISMVPGGSVPAAAATAASSLVAPSLGSLRRDAEAALKDSDRAYLVIVDDIDRLLPDELLMLFKVIRLVGRLPNVHYLLSYDEQSVIDALKTSSVAGTTDRAMAYLEKIVQVPVNVPPLHSTDVEDLVNATWMAVHRASGEEPTADQQRRFARVFDKHLRQAIRQPRQVVRLFAQVHHHWPLVKNEVDLVDLVLLTFLRTSWPNLYNRLPDDGVNLVSTVEGSLRMRNLSQEQSAERWQRLLRDCEVPESRYDEALELLCELFPGVATAIKRSHPDEAHLRNGKRVGSAEYFERYFQLGIPPDDLPDAQVATAVLALADGDEEGSTWLEQRLPTNPRLVLSKMRQAAETAGPHVEFSPAVAHFLVRHLDLLESAEGGLFSPVWAAYGWTGRTLLHWTSDVRSEEVPRLLDAPRGLGAVVHSLDLLRESDGGEGTSGEPPAFSEVLGLALPKAMTAVREAASGPLLDGELPWILHALARQGGKDQVTQLLDETLDTTRWKTIDFVACFVSVLRTVGTDIKKLGDLSVGELNELVPIRLVLDRLAAEIDSDRPRASDRDVSHAARVSRALDRLRELRDSRPDDLPVLEQSAISTAGPAQLATWSGSRPELLLRAVAALEEGPQSASDSTSTRLTAFEPRIAAALNGNPLTKWLAAEAAQCGAEGVPGWEVQGTSGSIYTQLRFTPAYASERSPLSAQASVNTGIGSGGSSGGVRLALVLDLGLNLLELDGQRRPSEVRHEATPPPAPAAVTLNEVASYLAELLRGAVGALPTIADVLSIGGSEVLAGLWVSTSGVDLDRVVKLDQLTRLPSSTSVAERGRVTPWPIAGAAWHDDPCRTWAIATLADLLQAAGYRDFHEALG